MSVSSRTQDKCSVLYMFYNNQSVRYKFHIWLQN